MVYCSKCGSKLSDDSNFCLKCGVRTKKGIKEGVSPHWAYRSNWEQEIEDALSKAAKNVEEAFNAARENIRRSINKKPIVCPKCKEENSSYHKFCYKCGTKFK